MVGNSAVVIAYQQLQRLENDLAGAKNQQLQLYAAKEQAQARKEREERMPLAELAAEADDWKQAVDPMTDNVYYLNDLTNEGMRVLDAPAK